MWKKKVKIVAISRIMINIIKVVRLLSSHNFQNKHVRGKMAIPGNLELVQSNVCSQDLKLPYLLA